jgi:LacI family transcriptional regulator
MRRKVAILVESSRAYGRGVLAGIAAYSHVHRNWSLYFLERMLSESVPESLKTWDVDGVIARAEHPKLIEFLQSTSIPAVDLRGLLNLPHIPLVETDDEQVVRLAFDELQKRGFRRFGYCGFDGANWSRRRKVFLTRILEEMGLPLATIDSPHPQSLYTTRIEASGEMQQEELANWLSSLDKPIGIIACNDSRALQLLNAARECRIEVPDEVAVVGIDNDSVLCSLADPPLSSVDHDLRRIGYEAAVLLDCMMAGDVRVDTRLLVEPLRVVTRQSSDVLAIRDGEVAAAMKFIREQACLGISVNDVVAAVPVSRSTLERRFTKGVGRSIKDEINRVRILRIKELLIHTDQKLSAISAKAGFAYAEYMNVMFKEAVGMTPGQYRRKLGQQDL